MRASSANKMGCGIMVFGLALAIFIATSWIGNLGKLIQCDFDDSKSWKGEVIHGIGLVPVISLVTVWNDDK